MERAWPIVVVPVRGRPQDITWNVGLLRLSAFSFLSAIEGQLRLDDFVDGETKMVRL